MLSTIRALAKTWVAGLLIGLLIISFAVFGVRDVFRAKLSTWVIQAGSRTVSPTEFRQAFDNFRKQAEQQYGQQISAQQAADAGLDIRLLDELATQAAFAGALDKAGVRPSDKLVAEQLKQIPGFFNPVSGQFDKAQYQQRLAENGMTEASFERTLRDELAQNQFATAVVNGLKVPRAYTALGALYGLEARDVGSFPVTAAMVKQPDLPTDEQLKKFMQDNAARLMRPETRIVTLVRFDPAQFASSMKVNEEDVKKRFDFRKDTLSKPETRSLVQIPAKDAATAQTISDRLKKGEDPAAVAKSLGVDAVTYEDKPQSAIVDHKAAAAAFALKDGEVSGPVQGDLGYAVIKVTKVNPGHQVTLEEVRPQIEAELRKDAATEKVYAESQKFEDAQTGGASLTEAAQKAGVAALTIGPFSEQGRGPDGAPVTGLSAKIVKKAFELSQGEESDIEEDGDGAYYALKVDRITPSALPPLEEVKPDLTRAWMVRQMVERMQAKADELAERVRKGESLEKVAASVGSHVTRTVGLDRATAENNKSLAPEAINETFSVKAGDVFTARGQQFEIIVAKLEAIREPTGEDVARLTEQSRPQVTMALFREFGLAAERGARTLTKVQTNQNRARQALGLDPIEPAKAAPAASTAEPAKKAAPEKSK
ncbi:SurA N-terminal domain-containing protein [Phenylobacterium sp.]|uniref:SurA N-terminal domain-containing protein n=1 Tax=Phenylobacterium sp. TaxID=1871053 RepID=UPI0035B4BC00